MGDPDVRLRVHRPKGVDGVLPCVYSMDGGGYVIGTNAIDDPMFDALCPKLGFVGVSVDYRLAPETPYPGPLEDCYQGLRWTYEHADELDIDQGRLGVMGVWDVPAVGADQGLARGALRREPAPARLPSFPTGHWRPVFEASATTGLPLSMHIGTSMGLIRPSPETTPSVGIRSAASTR